MRALLLSLFLPAFASAQLKLLHFTRTSGYDHGTRQASLAMFESLATELGHVVTNDDTGDAFSDPLTLAEFSFIVFSNTSGDAILTPQQRANFEQWVADGGRVLGIHAATDTYRHSTANGSSTGTWDFYAELMGASVQQNPNHVVGTPTYSMTRIGSHPGTANLPDPWVKAEEYYYWEGGYQNPGNVEVLRVEETMGPNGQVNSYDAPRPMSWYREWPGGKVFCTALGHAVGNFTDDALFREHIRSALLWLDPDDTGAHDAGPGSTLVVSPIPAKDHLVIHCATTRCTGAWRLIDSQGRALMEGTLVQGTQSVQLPSALLGIYQLVAGGSTTRVVIAR